DRPRPSVQAPVSRRPAAPSGGEEVSVSLENQLASTSEPVGYWALLRDNPRYRRLWLGLVVSMAGDWCRTIALYHLVLHLTGASGLALGGVVLAQTLSLFLMSPVAGVVADRETGALAARARGRGAVPGQW